MREKTGKVMTSVTHRAANLRTPSSVAHAIPRLLKIILGCFIVFIRTLLSKLTRSIKILSFRTIVLLSEKLLFLLLNTFTNHLYLSYHLQDCCQLPQTSFNIQTPLKIFFIEWKMLLLYKQKKLKVLKTQRCL